jgi:hypothetical protein
MMNMMSDWNMFTMGWSMTIGVVLVLATAVTLGYLIGKVR